MIKKVGKKEIHYAYLIELISDTTHKRKYVKVGMVESMMRQHFKKVKGSHYIRQDRFQRTFPSTEDYNYIWQEAQHLAKRYDH